MCRICTGEVDIKEAGIAEYIRHKKFHLLYRTIDLLPNALLLKLDENKEIVDNKHNTKVVDSNPTGPTN